MEKRSGLTVPVTSSCRGCGPAPATHVRCGTRAADGLMANRAGKAEACFAAGAASDVGLTETEGCDVTVL